MQLDEDASGDINVDELLKFVRLRTKDLKLWAEVAYERIAQILARRSPSHSSAQVESPDLSEDAPVAQLAADGGWNAALASISPEQLQLTLRTFLPLHALLLQKLIGAGSGSAGLALPDLFRGRPRDWRASPCEVWSLFRNDLSLTPSECADDLLAALVLWMCEGSDGVPLSDFVRLLQLPPTQVEACFWAGMRGYFDTRTAGSANERRMRTQRPLAGAAEKADTASHAGVERERGERPRLLPYKTSATNALEADTDRQSPAWNRTAERTGFGGKRMVGVGAGVGLRAKRAQHTAAKLSAVGLGMGGASAAKAAASRGQRPRLEAAPSPSLHARDAPPAAEHAAGAGLEQRGAEAAGGSYSGGHDTTPGHAPVEHVPGVEVQAARERVWAADLQSEPANPPSAHHSRAATPDGFKPPFSPAHIRASTPGETRVLTPADGAMTHVAVFLPMSGIATPDRRKTPERTTRMLLGDSEAQSDDVTAAPTDPMWAVSWGGGTVDFATVHSDAATAADRSRRGSRTSGGEPGAFPRAPVGEGDTFRDEWVEDDEDGSSLADGDEVGRTSTDPAGRRATAHTGPLLGEFQPSPTSPGRSVPRPPPRLG